MDTKIYWKEKNLQPYLEDSVETILIIMYLFAFASVVTFISSANVGAPQRWNQSIICSGPSP